MGIRKLLVVGQCARARRKLAGLIGGLHSVSVVEAEDGEALRSALTNRRIDAILAACAPDMADTVDAARYARPGMPVVAYADAPDYATTRAAFIAGAKDVLDLSQTSTEALRLVLERAMDPGVIANIDASLHIMQCTEEAARRGAFLEERLVSGNPPPFYMNGNRAELLRADMLSVRSGAAWRAEAARVWVEEFGARNSLIFPDTGGALRVGAVIEQEYINHASFRRMLDVKLARCFDRLRALGGLCAATCCSADYLGASVARQLDSLTELVFYMDDCVLLPDGLSRKNTILPDSVYHEFCHFAAVRDADTAVKCVKNVAERLRADMPPPDFARMKLTNFLWNLASVAHTGGGAADLSLSVNDERLTAMQDSIERIVRTVLARDATGTIRSSPIEVLVGQIDANPGLSINIDQAAEQVGFSRSHFCRLFRQQTGESFIAYLTRKRVALACDLLRKTGMRPDEVAGIVGIPNTWYFKKVFAEQMGRQIEDWLNENRP